MISVLLEIAVCAWYICLTCPVESGLRFCLGEILWHHCQLDASHLSYPQPQENKSFLLGQWYCGYEQGLFSFVSSLKGINHVLTSDLSICVASCVLYAVKKSELFFVSRGVTVHAYPGLTDADLAKTASEALFIQLLLGSSSATLPTSCSRDAIACWVVCMSYKTRLTLRSNFSFFHHWWCKPF